MTESIRVFPSNAEVDAWLAEMRNAARVSVALRDQLEAAAHDTDAASEATVRFGRAMGLTGQLASEGPQTPEAQRFPARMLMAAHSAGIKSLCSHVNQAKPLFVRCDPPLVACRDCLLIVKGEMLAEDYRWNNECDACGSKEETMYSIVTNIGYLQIGGNVCQRCKEASLGGVG